MKSPATTSFPTRCGRVLRLLSHLAVGVLIVATRYSRLAQAERAVVTRRWAQQALKILGVSIKVQGVNPGFYPPNTLLVANHVSWLDIAALNSCTVSRFVAKREIRSWPLIGWLAYVAGTLFIDRSNRRDASRVNQILADAMSNGGCMAVFPESTTSDGSSLLPFKASLFEAALLSGGTVQPVSLRYQRPDGSLLLEAAYIGQISLFQSIGKVLSVPQIEVEICYGQALRAGDAGLDNRFLLAEQARREVARGLRISLEDAPQAAAPAETSRA
ncbi:1-acyl-sn-glycerol-3-phosphate acyltransferase [Chromobacterium subtsugae]|uniref:1-acyl-sn-glycerol-3-phosphate acyltransferase n=1 Tax=Chromobacterium subtsugae TaxID=251747 RepID=A0ABS7FFP8_9NEIS|nr:MULTISPECIES: lysophospholipid acyltransferase family protein [Chromobacterium]KUM03955.1 acyl-phosphate glycerol 3-phosphate acyltransferase [Chromobacterium subtsugae]KZE86416.1 acyl-phosphate glycerol 3-phosphate acyltransferase [Chromobacterium sp. F49]MBW7567674.1 1-acyl-sn-glycerol-3-phosphate acyltransferase [Chromobacterium subtsugae]MBW8288900.1 1-acyl-sn-glycerol-3-phosphate acyltransferase [Chromobacterium subtsugae]OBU85709.1 acyl-phosphate glycerol 3-phosphate acyltransferase [